jgi:ubiquinone/menaquinone biosynthesis C-methylase UbiE
MEKEYAEYLLKKIKKDYNLIAEDFSITRSSIWPETKSLFDRYLFSGEKILDLGCGNGRYFEYLKDKNINYFGVDISENLIRIAKNKYPEANFQVADALNLPFPDNFFDKAIGVAVFHHIPSKELRFQFLKEVKRVLKPGGILILTVWNFREAKEFFLYFKFVILKIFGSKLDFGDFLEPWGKKILRYYHYFSKKELDDLTKRVRLKVEEIGVVKNERGNRRNTYLIAEK